MAVQAQSSVWDTGKDVKKAAADKTDKTTHKLKDFKKHLQQWGLDSNYNHGFLVGGKANSNGWSGNVYYQIRNSRTRSTLWQLSFSEIKHEKQAKQTGQASAFPQLGSPTPFIFGKINNLYTLQLGFAKEHLLLPAILEGNLSVSFLYGGGFSLAMLKPYYLKLVYVDYASANDSAYVEQQKYSTANSAKFLNNGSILGAAKWSKGLDDIDYVPGPTLRLLLPQSLARTKLLYR